MNGPDDPFSFDAGFGDPDYVKSARDPNLPPQTGKEWVDCRASDIPVTEGGERSPFVDLDDEFGTSDAPASQDRTGERAGTDDQNPVDDFSGEFGAATARGDDSNPPASRRSHGRVRALLCAPRLAGVPVQADEQGALLQGRLSRRDNRRGNDPQMVGLLAKSHDRRAHGIAYPASGRSIPIRRRRRRSLTVVRYGRVSFRSTASYQQRTPR